MTADWASVHVFSQGSLDDMIAELAGEVLGESGFFLRYWEGGPHLRIRVRGVPVESLVLRAEAYLREHPSVAAIDPEEYARLAGTLAAREGLSGYARELHPNDTVQIIPYTPEHDRYGTGRSLEAVERHFHESSRIVLDLLTARLPASRRGAAWLTMLLVARQVADGGRFLAGAPVRVPAARERVEALAVHAKNITSRPPPERPSGVVAGWYASADRLARELAEAGFGPERVGETLDLAAHLLANRLGIRVQEEARLRALAEPETEVA